MQLYSWLKIYCLYIGIHIFYKNPLTPERIQELNDYYAPVKISYDEWATRHLENMANSPDVDVAPKTIEGHREALEVLGRTCKPKSPLYPQGNSREVY